MDALTLMNQKHTKNSIYRVLADAKTCRVHGPYCSISLLFRLF